MEMTKYTEKLCGIGFFCADVNKTNVPENRFCIPKSIETYEIKKTRYF